MGPARVTSAAIFPMLVIVPVKSAHETDPLFLQPLGAGALIDLTLEDAERQAGRGDATLCITTDDDRMIAHVNARRKGWTARKRGAEERQGNYFSILSYAHDWARNETGREFKTVLILEPSHPFRPPGLIASAIAMLEGDPGLDTVVSVVREYGNLWTDDGRGNLHRTTTALGKSFYREVAGLCLLTRPATLAGENAIGHDVGFVVVEEQWALIDIHGTEGVVMARRFHDLLATQPQQAKS